MRILFTCALLFTGSVSLAQVNEAELKSAATITPFLIKNGCAEKVTLMMFIAGERATDCYGILMSDVKVTGEALGNVIIFPAARDLANAEELVADIRYVLRGKKTRGIEIQMSALRYIPQPLALRES